MKRREASQSGIKGIARALGVSIGTVDRALHDRAGVRSSTRAKVLEMALKLDYRPNVAARNLKLNRSLRIAVHLPQQMTSFFDLLRAGIQATSTEFRAGNLELLQRTYPRLDEGDLELLEKDLSVPLDGVIMTPGNPRKVDPLLRQFAAKNVPVVCVASDTPHSPRLGSVGVDAFVSGGIAAELLAMRLAGEGCVAVITGDLTTQDHSEKLRGFVANLALLAPHLRLFATVECHDRPEDAYRQTLHLLNAKPRPSGIYVSTANSLPVLRAIEEKGLLGKIAVVTTDLFADLVPLIESGGIFATLNQRPFTQGKLAFELLTRYLVDGEVPQHVTKVAPHIVLRSNLSLFSQSPAQQSVEAKLIG